MSDEDYAYSQNSGGSYLSNQQPGTLYAKGGVRPKAAPAAPKTTEVEIVVVANFPSPWSKDETAEVKMMEKPPSDDPGKPHWSPTIKDFEAAAETVTNRTRPTRVISSLGELIVDVIGGSVERRQQISRLNLISHANESNLAMRGTVDADGFVALGDPVSDPDYLKSFELKPEPGDVLPNPNVLRRSEGIDTHTLIALENYLKHEKSGLKDRIKKAWAKDATLWIYACNAAVGKKLTATLARVLGVKVMAFDNTVWFLPEFSTSPYRVNRKCFSTGQSWEIAKAQEVKELQLLDKRAIASYPPTP